MNLSRLCGKVARGWPYLFKELRAGISNRTGCFIARPRIVHFWRKGPCDGGCIMCHLGYSKGKQREELFHSRIKDEWIPGLLRQIQELGGRGTMVSYMCGEPLLNRSMLDWVEQAKRLRLDFRFTTNGYHVNREMAQRLVAAGLFNLGVSIESLDPAINEQIRPYQNSTDKAVGAIELLLEEKRRQHSPLSLNLKCTLTNVNLESVLDLVQRDGLMEGVIVTPQIFEVMGDMPPETAEKLRIRDVSRVEAVVRELKALKAQSYHINADDDALENLVRLCRLDPGQQSTMYGRKVRGENQADCFIGTDNLFITDGSVHLCPYFPPIGDVLNERASLKEMWRSEPARRVREQIRKCRTLCTMSCTRRMSLAHKVRMFLQM
jgi:MoaA/NifB/PqqE/SkfB family radical SAM enzyme